MDIPILPDEMVSMGGLHPNELGHTAAANQIMKELDQSLWQLIYG